MNVLLQLVLEVVWFFLPALVANMMPVLVANIAILNQPLDMGLSWRGRRLLGNNKTLRGLLFGIIFGSITSLFQHLILDHTGVVAALGWGALLGFGALFGDALKSFIKRQLDIAPGSPWQPFDQIDVVIGVLLVTVWWIDYSWQEIVTAFVVVGCISYMTSIIGVHLKIKKSI